MTERPPIPKARRDQLETASHEVEVPLSKIEVGPLNILHGRSLKEEGTVLDISRMPVLLVRPNRLRKGVFDLLSDPRWLAAAEAAGTKRVWCLVRDLSDAEAFIASWTEQAERDHVDPITRAQALERVIPSVFERPQTFADAIGVDRRRVADHLAVLKLCPHVQELVRRGTIARAAAVALAYAFKEEDEQRRVADRLRGKSPREQVDVIRLHRDVPTLLKLEPERAQDLAGSILTKFSPQQRAELRRLYKQLGLNAERIPWTRMTREDYAKDIRKKEYLLSLVAQRRRAHEAAGNGSSSSASGGPPAGADAGRLDLASLPSKAEIREVEAAFDAAFARLEKVTLAVEGPAGKDEYPLEALRSCGLDEDELLRWKASMAIREMSKKALAPPEEDGEAGT